MSHRIAVSLFVFCFACSDKGRPLRPEEPTTAELSSYLDRSHIQRGDTVTFRIVLEHHRDTTVELQTPEPEILQIPVVEHGQEQDEPYPGRVRTVFWFQLKPEKSELYTLPSWSGRYLVDKQWIELEAPALILEVSDQLTGDERLLKNVQVPEASAERSFTWLFVFLVVAAILTAGGLFVAMRGRSSVPPSNVTPPEIVAFRALQSLSTLKVEDSETTRKFCFELTSILKAYLEAVSGLNTTDLTTEEIADALESSSLPSSSRTKLLDIFRLADRVKYAGESVPSETLKELLRDARSFVDRTFSLMRNEQVS